MKLKRLLILAMFTAIALVIHTVEALFPIPVPVPGIKLGLSNIVTLFILFAPNLSFFASNGTDGDYGFKNTDALIVLLCRVLLGSLIAGGGLGLLYGLAGGLLALAAQIVLKRFVTRRQIWACGTMGAIIHNVGQILVAMLVMGTPALAAYLPVLVIAGAVTGTATGFITQLTVLRLRDMSKL